MARIQHPDLGLISPGRFIPMAKDLELMDAISTTMQDHALIQF